MFPAFPAEEQQVGLRGFLRKRQSVVPGESQQFGFVRRNIDPLCGDLGGHCGPERADVPLRYDRIFHLRRSSADQFRTKDIVARAVRQQDCLRLRYTGVRSESPVDDVFVVDLAVGVLYRDARRQRGLVVRVVEEPERKAHGLPGREVAVPDLGAHRPGRPGRRQGIPDRLGAAFGQRAEEPVVAVFPTAGHGGTVRLPPRRCGANTRRSCRGNTPVI